MQKFVCLVRPLWRASLVLVLGACANPFGIEPHATLAPFPADVAAASDAAQAVLAPDWWAQWHDAQLNALVTQAVRDNPTLRVAAARVRRAQAQTQAARAQQWPSLELDANATRQHYTATGMVPAPLAGSVQNVGTLQMNLGWEADLFGRQRAALDAAVGTARAAAADAAAARLMLATQIVRSYIELAHLQARLDVIERTYAQREQMLELVRARLRAGLDTELELRQSEGLLPQSRQQARAVREQMDLARNALAVLVGDPAQATHIQAVPLASLAALQLPQAIPLDLLGRRADIVAARWRVEAAQAGIAQARTLFYPNLNLMGFLGFNSLGLNHLIGADSRQWGVGPALSLPIFDAGRLRANLEARTADADEAVEQYNAQVLVAVREVADALVSLRALNDQVQEQAQALSAAEHAWNIAQARYGAGLSNYLQVLAAETNVLQQRLQTMDLTARALDVHAQLALALGGGYQAEADQDF